MFNRISTKSLIYVSRSLGTSLHAGIDIVKAFEIAGRKSRAPVNRILEEITQQIRSGEEVGAAFRSHQPYFPDLFCDMVETAEHTGSLPEVFEGLSEHYENNLKLRNDFLGQIALPMIQLLAAILIIAGVIWIMGWISAVSGATVDVLGFGLIGTDGAVKWLTGWGLLAASLFIGYKLLATSLAGLSVVHRLLLQIPVVGHCMQSFAVARFSWAFHLTQNAGLPIQDSLDASFRATSNGAFIAATKDVTSDVMSGETLSDSLAYTKLFPLEFVELVYVAENAGTVPEQLHRLSPQFEQQARRAMAGLTMALGWLIWATVAAFIIFAIFRIAFWYLAQLNSAIDM